MAEKKPSTALSHEAEVGVLGPQLRGDLLGRLDGRVLLGVQGHRGARLDRGGADPRDVGRRDAGPEEQPDRGRLDRDLGRPAVGQSLRAELAEHGAQQRHRTVAEWLGLDVVH